jgi:uncharacterized protein YjiS (DUF1127 family)
MTYATYKHDAVGGISIWQRLSEMTARMAQRRAQHRAYNVTVNELVALSDRDLTDLGIHRADIHDIARQAAYAA